MQPRASKTERLARRAVRRGRVADAVRLGGRWSALGAAFALVLVGLDRVWPLWTAGWILIAVPPAVGVGVALITAALGRRTLMDSASRLDRALGLHDTLGNGLALADVDDPFAQIAVRDAERAADGADAALAVPVRWSSTWLACPVLCSAAVLVWVFVPHAAWSEPPTPPSVVSAEEAADELRALVDESREELSDAKFDTPAMAEALETMDRLEEELRGGEREPDDARLAAADSFDQLADQMQQSAEREERVDDSVRDRLSGLESEEAGELGDRLREGDFEAARQAARESLRGAPEMTDAQRERLQQELTDLADSMDRLAQPPPGLDDLAQVPPDVDEQAEQLEREGFDQDTARRLAEQQQSEREQSEAEREAQQEMEQLRDALREAAERLNDPPIEEEPPELPPPAEPDDATPESESQEPDSQNDDSQPQADQPQDADPEQRKQDAQDDQQQENEQGAADGGETDERPGTEQEQQPGDQQPGEQQPGKQQGDKQSDQPGADDQLAPGQGQEQPDQDQPGDQPGQQRSPEPGQKPGGEQVPSPQPNPGPGEEPTIEQRPDGQPSPQGQPQPSPGPGEDSAGEPQPIATPGEQEESDPVEGESQQPSDEQHPIGDGAHSDDAPSLDEVLRRMAQRDEQIERQQQQSDRMRERAQELLDNATPQQREQLERWGEAMRSQQTPATTPGELDDRATTPADLRPRDPTSEEQERERVIAEWFNQKQTGDGERISKEAVERVREAADSALRAVEDQAVPVRRRELIKRVFDGVKERSDRQPAQEGERQ